MSMSSQFATRRSRASVNQLRTMVDLLEANPSLANGDYRKLHGKMKFITQWIEIKDKLNAAGECQKSVDQWLTVWRDLKSRTMIRLRLGKREKRGFGKVQLTKTPLTETECRVVALIENNYQECNFVDAEKSLEEDERPFPVDSANDTVSQWAVQLGDTEEGSDFQSSSMMEEEDLGVRGPSPKLISQTQFKSAENITTDADTKAKVLRIIEQQSDTLRVTAFKY